MTLKINWGTPLDVYDAYHKEQNFCGDCTHWMIKSQCPYEKSRKRSMADRGCFHYERKKWHKKI